MGVDDKNVTNIGIKFCRQHLKLYIQSLVDQLASVGIPNPILILESLQVPIHDDRLNIHEVRQILDASIRDHPMSSVILGTIAIQFKITYHLRNSVA